MADAARFLKRADAWIFCRGDLRAVAALRIGISAILLWRLTVAPWSTLANQPDELFRPVSFMHLFGSMPSADVVHALFVIAMIAALMGLFGLWSRIALPIALVCALVLFGLTTSGGKIAHNDVTLMLVLIPLAFGTTDRVWSLRHRVNGPKEGALWPLQVAVLLIVGAYFFSGLAKLTHSGPAWAFSDNLRWILYANSDGRDTPNPIALFVADHRVLAWAGSISILVVELCFPLILKWRALALLAVPLASAFHLGTHLTLGLDYSAWIALDVVVLGIWLRSTARAGWRLRAD